VRRGLDLDWWRSERRIMLGRYFRARAALVAVFKAKDYAKAIRRHSSLWRSTQTCKGLTTNKGDRADRPLFPCLLIFYYLRYSPQPLAAALIWNGCYQRITKLHNAWLLVSPLRRYWVADQRVCSSSTLYRFRVMVERPNCCSNRGARSFNCFKLAEKMSRATSSVLLA